MPTRLLAACVAALAVCWAGSAGAREGGCEHAAHPATEMGIRSSLNKEVPLTTNVKAVEHEGVRYMRVSIRLMGKLDSCDWHLTVRNKDYHVVQTLTKEDFRAPSGGWLSERWTMRVPDDKIHVEVQRCEDRTPSVWLSEYIAMPYKLDNAYYSLEEEGKKKYTALFENSEALRPLGDPVGFLMNSWVTESGNDIWTCSGFMVAADLFMTNWHCGGNKDFVIKNVKFWNPKVYNDTIIDLSWDGDKVSREYTVTGVAMECETYDFVILDVEPLGSVGRARPAQLTTAPVDIRTKLHIVHHAEALQKQITTGCRVIEPEKKGWRGDELINFTHNCDTEGGSSGSPIFDNRGYVVGLHHRGHEFDETTCKKKYKIDFNKAVRMDKILALIAREREDIYKRLTVRK